ncbi:MAG: carbon storage regulator CsrA [Clostridiales bacterium]|nr:carbon storage regulator CsrA [Clostridiales bacterium]
MLVLTRKLNEALKIGDDVTVTVLSIDGDRIRLGIEAPEEIRIVRKELLEEIEQANQLATQSIYFLKEWRRTEKKYVENSFRQLKDIAEGREAQEIKAQEDEKL